MNPSRLLVVNDETPVRSLIRTCFEQDGNAVDEAENMTEAYAALAERKYDLVTLDTIIGSENGMQHLHSIKAKHDVFILMVTGKGEVIDRVVGLEWGADDYVVKPFHVRELLARTRALLRRRVLPEMVAVPSPQPQLFRFEDWLLNADTRELFHSDHGHVAITTADYDLLLAFLNNPRKALSRDKLMDLIGGQSWTPLDRAIDNKVARLRRKIEADPLHPKIIKTVRGIGYIFTANVSSEWVPKLLLFDFQPYGDVHSPLLTSAMRAAPSSTA